MNRRVYKIGWILCMLILLVGCTNTNSNTNTLEASYELYYYDDIEIKEDTIAYEIDNTTPYQELCTQTVDIHAFAQRFCPDGMRRDIDDVREVLGIECLRRTEEGALYSVHKVTQGGLLYIFYNHYENEDVAGSDIRQWFYVHNSLFFSDFENLKKAENTIEDVIRINEAEQIYLNIYQADPMFQLSEENLYTTHYLKDGILDVKYDLVDGKLVFVDAMITEDFNLRDVKAARDYPYDARILDMDWIE